MYLLCFGFSFGDKYYCLFLLYKNAMQAEQDTVGELFLEILGRTINQRIKGIFSASKSDPSEEMKVQTG